MTLSQGDEIHYGIDTLPYTQLTNVFSLCGPTLLSPFYQLGLFQVINSGWQGWFISAFKGTEYIFITFLPIRTGLYTIQCYHLITLTSLGRAYFVTYGKRVSLENG